MQKPRIGISPYFNYTTLEEYMPEGYIRAAEYLNSEMVVLHYDLTPAELNGIVAGLDGIIFSGGADVHPQLYHREVEPECGRTDPARDAMEKAAFELASARNLPMLGICRGLQLINALLGGTLVQDIPTAYPGAQHEQQGARHDMCHEVTLIPGTPLGELFEGQEKLMTNSFHHQCVKELAPGLVVNAVAAEGFPEAFTAMNGRPILCVQWHPEVSFKGDEASRKVFDLFRTML